LIQTPSCAFPLLEDTDNFVDVGASGADFVLVINIGVGFIIMDDLFDVGETIMLDLVITAVSGFEEFPSFLHRPKDGATTTVDFTEIGATDVGFFSTFCVSKMGDSPSPSPTRIPLVGATTIEDLPFVIKIADAGATDTFVFAIVLDIVTGDSLLGSGMSIVGATIMGDLPRMAKIVVGATEIVVFVVCASEYSISGSSAFGIKTDGGEPDTGVFTGVGDSGIGENWSQTRVP
jgi:hypothetical protein